MQNATPSVPSSFLTNSQLARPDPAYTGPSRLRSLGNSAVTSVVARGHLPNTMRLTWIPSDSNWDVYSLSSERFTFQPCGISRYTINDPRLQHRSFEIALPHSKQLENGTTVPTFMFELDEDGRHSKSGGAARQGQLSTDSFVIERSEGPGGIVGEPAFITFIDPTTFYPKGNPAALVKSGWTSYVAVPDVPGERLILNGKEVKDGLVYVRFPEHVRGPDGHPKADITSQCCPDTLVEMWFDHE